MGFEAALETKYRVFIVRFEAPIQSLRQPRVRPDDHIAQNMDDVMAFFVDMSLVT